MKHTITKLVQLRRNLDKIDRQLFTLLAKRFQITHQVGVVKKQYHLPAIDQKREHEQLLRVKIIAENIGLDSCFAQKILRLIIDEVVKNHRKIINNK